MALAPDEREMLMEARDLSRSTKQTMDEVVVPFIQGDGRGNLGAEARIKALETDRLRREGMYKIVIFAGVVANAILMLVFAAWAAYRQ